MWSNLFYKSRFKDVTSHSNDIWVNNSTVHSALLFMRHVFMFVGTRLNKSHYKPSLHDRVETYLHLGVDIILSCTLSVFQN
jgi:hypothetical protein